MNDSERMTRLLLELKMDAEALGKSIGKKKGDTIRNVINKKNNISARLARLIAEKHQVNFKWLMTGEGEIFQGKIEKRTFNTGEPDYLLTDKDEIIKFQRELISQQRELIEKLLKQIEEFQGVINAKKS